MGAEQSQLKGLQIEKKAIEVTDHWTVYAAEVPNESSSKRVTIFQGQPALDTHLWGNYGPLDKATRNLMIYRHPSILKFIASWNRGSMKFLATENCRPLSLVIANQTDIEICLGLKNILTSLIFLIEQANVRHINICTSSIYVSDDGTWKLSGFEFLWKSNELTNEILEKSNSFRYKKAIDTNEVKNSGLGIEQYAFGVLCEESLQRLNEESTLFLKDFKTYCSTHLKHSTPSMRPKLSAILLHSYFNHDFITIHSFLNELPLKNHSDKQTFFTNLIDRLRNFDETIIANQLGNVLLSRIVLLDPTAQTNVLPYILKPRTENFTMGLFASDIFESILAPKLMKVFCVRDAQIRLILLEYFSFYVNTFSRENIKDIILPQLLLGIKDTNDLLVATTLRCLAELVEILGSATVIGSNRLRIFADGRPQGPPDLPNHWIKARSITPVLSSAEFASNGPLPDNVDISECIDMSQGNLMAERLSPDGGEDLKASELDEETWTDWEEELEELTRPDETVEPIAYQSQPEYENSNLISSDAAVKPPKIENIPSYRKKSITEIDELDIKNQKVVKKTSDEVDFFKDMEPVIQKTNNLSFDLNIENDKKPPRIVDVSDTILNEKFDDALTVTNRFDIKVSDDNEDGWGDDTDNNVWDNV